MIKNLTLNIDRALTRNSLIEEVSLAKNLKDMTYLEDINIHESLDSNDTTLLHLAAELDNYELIKHLINKGINVNLQNKVGRTALLYAVKAHSITTVEVLLDLNADMFIEDKYGHSALNAVGEAEQGFSAMAFYFYKAIIKIAKNNQEIAEILLKANWHMRHVVNMCNSEVAKIMLKSGCSIDNIDETFGNTLLHEAVRWGDLEMVQVLVTHGADVNAENIFGEVPLGSLEIVPDCPMIVEYLFKVGLNLNDITEYGRMQYYNICRTGDSRSIELVLKYCDINQTDNYDEGILHYVATNKDPGVADLFDANVKLFRTLNVKNKKRKTPLHVAVECVNIAFVKFLLKNHANVNSQDVNDCTPLYNLATIQPIPLRQECAQFLLDYGANVNRYSTLPVKTALQVALQCEYYDIAAAILDKILCLDVLAKNIAKENSNAIEKHDFARGYYYPRLAELLFMSKTIVHKKITFLNLMTYSPKDISLLVGNQTFLNAFNNSNYEIKFPFYYLTLKRNVLLGLHKRNDLWRV